MPIDATTLGQRLREARENRGMTQQHAAQELDLPRTAIVQVEAGNRSVSSLELIQLANLYRVTAAYLLEESAPAEEENLLVALHRLAPGIENDSHVKGEVERCILLCQEAAAVGALIERGGQGGPPAYDRPMPRSKSEAVDQGEAVAEQERQRLDLGTAPIADVADLIASQGIWASGVRLPDEMSGLFLHHPSLGLAILVNYDHARSRKRFSYAHEYAHALLDGGRTVTVSSADTRGDLIETRANAFAAALLMPPRGIEDLLRSLDKGRTIRRDLTVYDPTNDRGTETQARSANGTQRISYREVAHVADRFGVSYIASAYRLRGLGYVSFSEVQELVASESNGRSYLKMIGRWPDLYDVEAREQGVQDRELTNQVITIALEAYRRDEISQGKLMDLGRRIGVSGASLSSLAQAAKA